MPGLFAGTPLERPVTCEVCGKALEACRCPRGADGRVVLPKDQPARVQRERRAGGKWVTVVRGLDAKATDLSGLLKILKARCAAGGAVTDDGVEVQGDHRDRVVELLKGMGYPAKAAGG
jgi:translation initiation factor 1